MDILDLLGASKTPVVQENPPKVKINFNFIRARCHPDRPHNAHGLCRDCYIAEYGKTYRKLPSTKIRQQEASWKQQGINITVKDYNSLLAEQKGVCAICECEPLTKRLEVDHDHKTGKVRGLLCNTCNRWLVVSKHPIDVLEQAIIYLKKYEFK